MKSATLRREYLLKVVDMDTFLLHSDAFLCHKILKKESHRGLHIDTSRKLNPIKSGDTTALFIDSQVYSRLIEKSHLKLTNNIVVLDRVIQLTSLEQAKTTLDMLTTSKRWLIHGKINIKLPNEKQIDVLLILDTGDEYLRGMLLDGFKQLIDSFTFRTKTTFEIEFQDILRAYLKHKPGSAPKHLNVDLSRFSVSLRTQHTTRRRVYQGVQTSSNDAPKLTNLFSRIRNVISLTKTINKANTQFINKLSLNCLPYVLCYLVDTKISYIPKNDDLFDRPVSVSPDLSLQIHKGDTDAPDAPMYNAAASSSLHSSSEDSLESLSMDVARSSQLHKSSHSLGESEMKRRCMQATPTAVTTTSNYSRTYSTLNASSGHTKEPTLLGRTMRQLVSNSRLGLDASMTSISSKAKALSVSFDRLSRHHVDNEQLIDNKSMDVDVDVVKIQQSTDSDNTHNSFTASDFAFRNRYENVTSTVSLVAVDCRDEKIVRHPALVKSYQKSKSYDFEKEKTVSASQVKTVPAPAKTKLFQTNTKRAPLAVHESNVVTRHKHSPTYAKCAAFKYQGHSSGANKRSSSPPPPIFISATGLLAPPPVSLPVTKTKTRTNFKSTSYKNSKENTRRTNDYNKNYLDERSRIATNLNQFFTQPDGCRYVTHAAVEPITVQQQPFSVQMYGTYAEYASVLR